MKGASASWDNHNGLGKVHGKKRESKPISLTRRSLALIIALCVFLSAGFGIGGAALGNHLSDGGSSSSSSAGKTRTINFYRINDGFRIVDLPGYGYAKVSRSVSESWGDMMETYLEKRGNLACVIQLVDIRHAPSRQDVEMQAYLRHYGLNGPVVATKADKISVNQRAKQIKLIRQTLGLEPGFSFVSARCMSA